MAFTPERSDNAGGRRPHRAAQIFTVPAGRPFLDALAQAVLRGDLPTPGGPAPDLLHLPRYTLLLPTRRAARALQEAFLRASGGKAMLLPRIRPIAEGQEDLSLLEAGTSLELAAGADDSALPVISELERRLVLTRLVMAWSEAQRQRSSGPDGDLDVVAGSNARTPAQAAKLGADLARLIDAVETENVDFSGLATLVPDIFSEHWQKTLEFLKIVTETLPAYLAERGLSSPMQRRNALVLAEAERLQHQAPSGPVIVAGVTGSIPATADLMRAVATLANGAIVLPALDLQLDDATWAELQDVDAGHPQFGFRMLLERLGLSRSDVTLLPGCAQAGSDAVRGAIMTEAMRPAASMMRWREFAAKTVPDVAAAALEGVCLIEAPSAQDEAEAIALMLRQAAETPGRTAALVSPDRLLGRRVAIRLESWGIRVDDSAGRPFAKTVPGAFLDLVVEVVGTDFQPAEMMALLKHPLTRLGLPAGQIRRAARALEIAAFRTMYLGRGLAGVEAALERAAREVASGARRQRAVRRLWDADWAAARDLVQRLQVAVLPLAQLYAQGDKVGLADLAAVHAAAAEAIVRPFEEEPTSPLWRGEAGEAASRLFAGLMNKDLPAPDIAPADYADFYRSLIVGESVRPRIPVHPRLFIWGPFEARLQQTDVMVLGSLNEGTWPAAADPGAWLNRPMRKALGLPAPEEEIGRAAHDFTTFLGAEQVVLTRATKIDGAPTVPSRWLMRLEALLKGIGAHDALVPREPWLAWARGRDHIARRRFVQAPEPRPSVELRPRRASVSDVETWIANPYAIFARHVLGMDVLPELGSEPGPQQKGQIVHEALSRFATRHADRLPQDVKGAFLAVARDVLQELKAHPRVAAFWLPRLVRFADWFAATEPARRRDVTRLVVEVSGQHVLEGPQGPFTLRARADRLDVAGKGLIITDYKTGSFPADARVLSGAAPQLPLEAAIAAAGGFDHLDAACVTQLRYIAATGGEPPGDEHIVKVDDVPALAGEALSGLERLIARFDHPETPYRAVRRARFRYDYDDYEHLARVAEWSAATVEEIE